MKLKRLSAAAQENAEAVMVQAGSVTPVMEYAVPPAIIMMARASVAMATESIDNIK